MAVSTADTLRRNTKAQNSTDLVGGRETKLAPLVIDYAVGISRLEVFALPFTGTRQDVAQIVLGVIRSFLNNNTIVEATTFGVDVIVEGSTRRLWAPLIRQEMRLRFPSTVLDTFGPDNCESARKVKDIVDAVHKDATT